MTQEVKLQDTKGDDWSSLAQEYKKFSTVPGTIAIKVLIERINSIVPFTNATGILDNGCGPGPITSRIIEQHGHEIPEGTSILAADFSEGMIAQVEAVKAEAIKNGDGDGKVWERVQTKLVDATDMKGVESEAYSHVLAGWVYFMTPDPMKCLTESLRVLKPGGVLGCTAWESSEWIDMMNTLQEVKPELELPKLPDAWKDADLLRGELEAAGFKDARTERVPVKMEFEQHETLVNFLIDRLPFAVSLKKNMTDEEVKRWKDTALARCKALCPETPGTLHGWSLMAIGRK